MSHLRHPAPEGYVSPAYLAHVSGAVRGQAGDALIISLAAHAGFDMKNVVVDGALTVQFRAFAHHLADVMADEAGTLSGALDILKRAGVRR